MYNVFIAGVDGGLTADMYNGREDFQVVNRIRDADLVQFTGGADVNPALYKQEVHPRTMYNDARDKRDIGVYERAKNMGLPMVGICRGGQFLNVMNKGTMYQHVDNHGIGGTHQAFLVNYYSQKEEETRPFDVTSTHHQMMIPGKGADLFLVAKESTTKQVMEGKDVVDIHENNPLPDIEGVFYGAEGCLCYQPHPEYVDPGHDCQELFFHMLWYWLGVGQKWENMNDSTPYI